MRRVGVWGCRVGEVTKREWMGCGCLGQEIELCKRASRALRIEKDFTIAEDSSVVVL